MRTRSWGLVLGSVAVVVGCAGCGTYWRNRSRDAAHMFDFGISTSKKFCLAFLPADYMNVTPIGFSRIEGRFHGIYKSHWGSWPISDRIWGVVTCGSQTLTIGEFDPNDPHQFPAKEIAELKAANKPLPTAPRRYNIGFLRVACKGGEPPYPDWFS
ncbi:MAG TPA: hypothetical protein VNE39_08940 [Planctomycetota bacterium]|nr:hypothetical protein [Planctomycetota bacterium]